MRLIGGLLVTSLLPAIAAMQPLAVMAESKVVAEMAFLPTWKLLGNDGKLQFVAGYLFGWRDAKRAMDVAAEFVKEHPEGAINGLERIRELYDTEGLTPDVVVKELDSFFLEAERRSATLSQAITAVRSRLGR